MKSGVFWGITNLVCGVALSLFAVANFAEGDTLWGSIDAAVAVISLTFGFADLWTAKLEGDIHG